MVAVSVLRNVQRTLPRRICTKARNRIGSRRREVMWARQRRGALAAEKDGGGNGKEVRDQ